MRTKLTTVTLFVFLLANCLFFAGNRRSIAASGISTGFELLEGYIPGNVDGQNGWEHDLSPGSWQVETNVRHSGDQAIQSPIGFNDTQPRATTKSFPMENTGDMVFYMRRDDNNLHQNNFYVGFTTDHGENPEVGLCMCEEGIIMQNTITGGFATLANPFTLGQWYKIHFKWDASTCQASLNDGSFSSISNPANMGFARIYIMARGQAVAYVDDIQDLTLPIGPAGAQVWNTFLGVLNFPYTASTFTPDNGITVTRIQAHLVVAPSGCTQNAVLEVSDGTPAGTLTLTLAGAANDSGPVVVNYTAGAPIRVSVKTPAKCSGTSPIAANVVVQYKAK